MFSRLDHRLSDILYRWRVGELAMNIVRILSNYLRETYGRLDFGDVPFDYLPVSRETKSAQEIKIWQIVQERRADLVMLAPYMQILSDDLSTRLSGRCINSHHSFLRLQRR